MSAYPEGDWDVPVEAYETPRPDMPCNVDAEREVLAAVFVDDSCLDIAIEHPLVPGDFWVDAHGRIYAAMLAVYESPDVERVELVAVIERLKRNGDFERVGGLSTLSALMERSGTTANMAHYCRLVSDAARSRDIIDAARSIEVDGLSSPEDIARYAEAADRKLSAAIERQVGSSVRTSQSVVRAAIAQIEAAFEHDGSVTGVPSGYRDVDRLLGGWQNGDLVIIAARPAMGKTSFVLNTLTNAAVLYGKRAIMFSLEMPAEQLATRQLASQARIDMSRLRKGMLSADDWPRLIEAADALSSQATLWDDRAGIGVSEIRAICRRLKRTQGLDMVVVDYLQLMGGMPGTGREQQIATISRSLKHLAKELSCPVIALSQLNRGPEQRTDKRPMMSDLRESGAIEQDADVIVFLYRDEVYNKPSDGDDRGISELIVAKHRNGPTGTVKLKFWSSYTRFDNLALAPEVYSVGRV